MLSTIRSRLWLSYSLVIVAALTGMIGTTISTLNRSPLFYRQAILQLRLSQSTLSSKIKLEVSFNIDKISGLLLINPLDRFVMHY
jgi:hypothetical protein